MATTRENINKWGAIVFGTLVAVGGGHELYEHLTGGGSASDLKLQMCPEPLTVISRSSATLGIDVVIQNDSQATLKDSFYTWQYDKDNVFLGQGVLMHVEGTPPGGRARGLVMLEKGATKVVICSMNPAGVPIKDV